MEGYIKLHRKMVHWEWYDNINTKAVFLDLLIWAQHKDSKWRGHTVLRGQLITSPAKIGARIGLSYKQVRTALEHLEESGEITTKGTNKNTRITLCHWDTYQSGENEKGEQNGELDGTQRASKGRAKGEQRATYKNVKKDKNEKKGSARVYPDDFTAWWAAYPNYCGRKTNKPQCLDKWVHLKRSGELPEQSELMRALDLHQQDRDWTKDEGRFWPGPLPYLNGQKWTSVLEAAPVRQSATNTSTFGAKYAD